MKTVECLFTVQKCESRGVHEKIDYTAKNPDGTYVSRGMKETFDVHASPFMTLDADNPNRDFFVWTPSGQLQFFGVANFNPRPGSNLRIRIDFEPAD